VHVPSLRERIEDIPLLADHFLRRFTRKHGVKATGFSESARAALLSYRWPGNVRELQNTVERAVILSESGRPVSAAALGLPGDLTAVDEKSAPAWESSVEPGTESAETREAPMAVAAESSSSGTLTDESGKVLRLDELEKQAIRAALRQTGGNRTQAAEALGISIRTLRNKLQEYREAGDPIDAGVESAEA
jgi:DNA-binding NtrC family response regulator